MTLLKSGDNMISAWKWKSGCTLPAYCRCFYTVRRHGPWQRVNEPDCNLSILCNDNVTSLPSNGQISLRMSGWGPPLVSMTYSARHYAFSVTWHVYTFGYSTLNSPRKFGTCCAAMQRRHPTRSAWMHPPGLPHTTWLHQVIQVCTDSSGHDRMESDLYGFRAMCLMIMNDNAFNTYNMASPHINIYVLELMSSPHPVYYCH